MTSKLPDEALEALGDLIYNLLPTIAQWRYPRSLITMQFKANEENIIVALSCLINFSLEYGIMPYHTLTEKQHKTLKEIEANLNASNTK